MRLGLGIDAGGTYTDTVLFDFISKSVLSKGKALTTRDDYTKGINNSLSQLTIEDPQLVDIVGLSTTLATNSLVEGKGARAGLVLIGYDPDLVERFLEVGPYWIVAGGHDMRGQERAPLDDEQVRQTIKTMSRECDVIAISQMGGAVNPEHERRVQELIEREFSIPAISGHEISTDMDSMKRATTVFWNAKLIPVILELIDAVKAVFRERGIDAPLMLVRSDGTMMGEELARRRPIETLMSGPVASIYGALYLTGAKDALVIDMGGTTTDMGLVKDGRPRLSPKGAKIGVYRTTVRTLDLHTIGLGGDSEISIAQNGRLAIGPRRVVPISLAAHQYPNIAQEMRDWATIQDKYVDARLLPPVEFYTPFAKEGVQVRGSTRIERLHGSSPIPPLTAREEAILAALESLGGASRYKLAAIVDYPYPSLLPLDHLEDLGLVQRVGLTPTDVLQALGRLESWGGDVSKQALQAFGERVQEKYGPMGEVILDGFRGQLADEMLSVLLTESMVAPGRQNRQWAQNGGPWGRNQEAAIMDLCPICRYLVGLTLDKDRSKTVSCSMQIGIPLVAVGAPVKAYFPSLAENLQTDLIIPAHADVANAIGAIVGSVSLAVEVVVAITGDERYIIRGMPENNSFDELGDALDVATDYVIRVAKERAMAAGAETVQIEIEEEQLVSEVGQETLQTIFLETKITARASGQPKTRD
ncbi:MAG: hydantoinase/oxoprolinase family protein [Firmicutes bacterium]|nr:hydantoinase/oxoprolinase family protein [Bacillota bacterium]